MRRLGLWEEYFDRLVRQARQRLRGTLGNQAEDVALSVFDSFIRRAAARQFPRLDDRDDLWQILLTLTARKAASLARQETSARRGGGQVQALSELAGSESASLPVEDANPTPAEAAAMAEECSQLLGLLEEELRKVAVWKMEGYTHAEVAERLGVSVPTVERKLALIRNAWRQARSSETDS